VAYNEALYGSGHNFDQLITAEGMAFIARWEQFVDHWYEDGIWRSGPKEGQAKFSIGFGHGEAGDYEPKVYDPTLKITYDQGISIFRLDLESKAKAVRNRLKVKVNSYQFNALVSLVFNYGQGSVDKVNSVFPLLNQELYVAASVGFLKCNILHGVEKNGLTVRRACEIALFATRIDQ